ncbi:hypothetical protein TrVE_jg3183 [Triparma verrucosa]|uniref:EGF-like domain-containing protein n=1 Tax=Triparma verrucosa TaxID=1606542 RepID=A0A9W7C247_9STRA|nr:hypothetical protein TrVE_jg3183 [Triparma verrucosa]
MSNILKLVVLLLLPYLSSAVLSATSLVFEPATLGTPTEITFTFTTSTAIDDSEQIRLDMPGFTRGTRRNTAGSNQLDQTLAKRAPDAKWNVYWYEGTVANSFKDSYMLIKPVQGTAGAGAGTTHIITIDRFMEIKANCATTATQVFKLTDETLQETNIASSDRTAFTGGCYFTNTRLDVVQPIDKTWMELSFQFSPAMVIGAGENITFNMAGFTNHNFTGIASRMYKDDRPGYGGGPLHAIPILPEASHLLFTAHWREGKYIQHNAGFTNSTFELTVKPGISLTPGTTYALSIDRVTNKIGTMCSLQEDFDKITISTNAVEGVVTKHRVEHTDAVGSGCSDHNGCSGHGSCNYCTETCNCELEYGGTGSIVESDIKKDCSERVCPVGYAWGTLPTSSDMGHPLKECSGSGKCNRAQGVCICFEGFSGTKCERRDCPIVNSEVCAGHGTCLSIRQLSSMLDAMPLSDPTDYANTGKHYPIYGGGREGNTGGIGNVTWDERTLYKCHCDSTWAVGLGSGETQEAEYFGDACQLRHCPSGDDPLTTLDETDCNGKVAKGGKGVGRSGNKCFVECSNRGVCEYETGLCQCFKGFWGSACEILKDVPGGEEEK